MRQRSRAAARDPVAEHVALGRRLPPAAGTTPESGLLGEWWQLGESLLQTAHGDVAV